MKKFTTLNESINFGGHDIDDKRIIYKDSDFFFMYDGYAVSPGHLLIITNGTEPTFFDLSDVKKHKLINMIEKGKELIEKEHKPDGYNIGMNCGLSAGQTVMQFHCHIIPRYTGDVENPRGGVRHSVVGKGYY